MQNKVKISLLLGLLVLCLVPGISGQIPLVVKENEGKIRKQIKIDETTIQAKNISLDVDALKDRLVRTALVSLFENTNYTIERNDLESVGRKGTIWKGNISGEPNSSVIFSFVKDVGIGKIVTQDGSTYRIGYLGNDINSLVQIDPSDFPDEGPPRRVEASTLAKADSKCNDPANLIDVLVVYSPKTREAAGGTDAMLAVINLAVSEANESYANSGINQRLRLVSTEEVDYAESGDLNTDLTKLQTGGIGNVLSLRNKYAADIVSMIVEEGGPYCGLGYLMSGPPSLSFADSAYNVVVRNCATGYFSFAHELGHNMGADHDDENPPEGSYNHGYFNVSPTAPTRPWRTIMSYQTSPVQSKRVKYWSNPQVLFGGDPMGITDRTDNHRVLNESAPTVANFRCK